MNLFSFIYARPPTSTLFPYTTLFRSLEDHGAAATHPEAAVLAAMISALTGKPGEAERWAVAAGQAAAVASLPDGSASIDRKSTRLNSSHPSISYAVFCLKKKKPG